MWQLIKYSLLGVT